MNAAEITRRHAVERPLAKLTEHELDVLMKLANPVGTMLKPYYAGALEDLGELAEREFDERDHDRGAKA